MKNRWPRVALGEVLTERQETPDPAKLDTGEMRIVSKIGFNTGSIEFRSDGGTKTKMITMRPGDLVVSGINAAKGAIAVYDRHEAEPAAATIHYGAYSVNDRRASVRFLWWLLRSNTFRDILVHHLPGGIKTELKAKRLLPIPVPLPPLSEQRRIVAKIQQLAAKIDEVRQLRASAERKASAILGAALGRLAYALGTSGFLRNALRAKPRNGWSARCDNAEDGTPVLSLSAVTGFEYQPSAYKRTSLPTSPDAHYWLRKDDLLMTRSNTPELVGHVAIYGGNPSPCIYPDLMMRLEVDEHEADQRFVWYWLQTPLVRDYITASAKGTSPTMKKISQGTVMAIPFPSSVPVSKQRRVVVYLDDLRKKIDRLMALQTQTAAELDALLPSILDKAFKGEL